MEEGHVPTLDGTLPTGIKMDFEFTPARELSYDEACCFLGTCSVAAK